MIKVMASIVPEEEGSPCCWSAEVLRREGLSEERLVSSRAEDDVVQVRRASWHLIYFCEGVLTGLLTDGAEQQSGLSRWSFCSLDFCTGCLVGSGSRSGRSDFGQLGRSYFGLSGCEGLDYSNGCKFDKMGCQTVN